ncbi:MAG: hypothetical protein HY316_06440 [Acidobacteria bacterium]|nr:hypothetical protein [Acidobacteriota bacterium]
MKVARGGARVLLLLGQMVAMTAAILAAAARGEIVDRVVAVVDPGLLGGPPTAGKIITWTAAYEEACYQAFQKGSEPPQWSPAQPGGPEQFGAVVSQMIDQILLEQALNRSPFAPAGEGDVRDRIQEIANRYPDAETYHKELVRYHLSEAALTSRLSREGLLLAFIDSTLRPDVRVTAEQVEGYYETVFLPQLETGARGAGPAAIIPPLEDVRTQIQEILTQQEMDRRLKQWLEQMRRTARIELRLE